MAMLDEIIDRELVGVAFEPFVDLRRSAVAGYDVVWRTPPWVPGAPGCHPFSARALRDLAFEQGRLLGLEHLWARKAVEAVARQRLGPHLQVHLALDPRLLSLAEWNPGTIARHARRRGASPARFVLCTSGTTERLRALCGGPIRLGLELHGAPSLDALLRVKPHVVRIDGQLTRGIVSDPARRETVRTLAEVARSEMIDLVARGVDDPRDLAALLDAGVYLASGAALAAPEPIALPLSQMRRDALATLGRATAPLSA